MLRHKRDRRKKIIHQLHGIDFLLERAAFIIIPRIAADGAQAIRRQRDISRFRDPPGYVFNVGIEASVLMYHHNGGRFVGYFRRRHQVSPHFAVAVRRGIMNILRTDIRVGERYLLCQGIVGLQQIKQRQRGHPADSIFPRQLEKLAFADFAVGIVVIILEQLLREIFGH